jgi:hypothetical protein
MFSVHIFNLGNSSHPSPEATLMGLLWTLTAKIVPKRVILFMTVLKIVQKFILFLYIKFF